MVSAETRSVIDRAKQIYANQLQRDLESQHVDRFVAIEPESGEYFRPVCRTPSGSGIARRSTSEGCNCEGIR
jgi:hypothetical protein